MNIKRQLKVLSLVSLTLEYSSEGHVTRIVNLPTDAPDARNTMIVLEYDAPIKADPNATGKYH